jgi:hypothetical protein
MTFDPLRKVQAATDSGLIPEKIYNRITSRFHLVRRGISRVERAARIRYPVYYVSPNLVISTSESELAQFGILFARTIPVITDGKHLNIVVQITAPLVAFGLLGTIHAVLAHEFMHYLNLLSRIIKMNVISDEISGTLFEENYTDHAHLLPTRAVFGSDPALVEHIVRKFPAGLSDRRLEHKVTTEWIDKGLPTSEIAMDANIVRIPVEVIASIDLDRGLKDKIFELETQKTRNRGYSHHTSITGE